MTNEYISLNETPISRRSGNKVSWKTFVTREEAERAAVVAKHNAIIDAKKGYDFGYQVPGEITTVENGFEVCFS